MLRGICVGGAAAATAEQQECQWALLMALLLLLLPLWCCHRCCHCLQCPAGLQSRQERCKRDDTRPGWYSVCFISKTGRLIHQLCNAVRIWLSTSVMQTVGPFRGAHGSWSMDPEQLPSGTCNAASGISGDVSGSPAATTSISMQNQVMLSDVAQRLKAFLKRCQVLLSCQVLPYLRPAAAA